MSAQALVRVGVPRDLYYSDADNCKKQAIPVEYNTRYSQDFSNKTSGVSVFVIPPNQGCKHVIVVLGYNAATITAQNGANALERGWGYNAVQQISFRIGGSSQYFLTGAQLLARNLRLVRTQNQRDALLSLGGNECKLAADFDVAQYAYIPISIWTSPGDDELNVPLPTDLLSQQVQVTVQLNPSASFWNVNPNATTPVAIPTTFDTAYFQIEQFEMKDRSMALANRVNMADHMYSMPLPTFDQQEVLIQLAASASVQQAVLTGFRSGEVKKLQIWLTDNADPANSQLWYAPAAVSMLFAGLVYPAYNNGSSAIWNLLDGTAPAAVNQSKLAYSAPGAGSTWVSTPVLSQWAELPFAQPTGSDYEAELLVHGKEITNGIVNLQVLTPDATKSYTMHVVYVYNCTLGFSKGTAELIF